MDITTKLRLNNDIMMPQFGLGVYQTKQGEETINAVTWALNYGYRLIDTARIYNNESEVGVAVANSSIPREDIFITTKLWNTDQGYTSTLKAFEKSLKKLKIEYLDLYLIHWPEGNKRKETWQAFEKLYDEKMVKAIGVSNYTIDHLKEMQSYANIPPVINQVEFNPYLYQKDLLEYCVSNNIKIEAYSPIARGKRMKDEKLNMLSSKYDKTPAQIMLRWALQHGIIIIPKSSHRERIEENADIFNFELADDDMKSIDTFNENFRTCWDPSNVK